MEISNIQIVFVVVVFQNRENMFERFDFVSKM